MVLPILISSLLYSKRRTVTELFSPRLKILFKEWDLRMMVLLSLTLQIVLIVLGNRRKYNHKGWINVVTWCAYLAADSVATLALGVLKSNLADTYDDNGRSLEVNVTAFWAPFLLLHLGGPDTITAFSLEDNELWLRHLLGLAVQTEVAVYVLFLAWTGSPLSILSVLMLFAGLIKYGERTWVLRSASNEKFRESTTIQSQRDLSSNISMSDRNALDRWYSDGHVVKMDWLIEVPFRIDLSSDISMSDEDKLMTAYESLDLSKRLFLDSVLTTKDRDITKAVFRNMSFKSAFQVIEIELGLIYDLFYNKAPHLYTPWGMSLRLITFILICLVLVLFPFLVLTSNYSKIDLLITFLLLVAAIVLEIYAALVLLFSDRFVIWLSVNNKTSILQALSSLLLSKSPRWSNKMPQYSLISFCMKEKPLPCQNILKLLNVHQWLEKPWYATYKEVPEDLKKLIFRYGKEKATTGRISFPVLATAPGEAAAASHGNLTEAPEFGEDLWKRIVFWHYVTEVSYYTDHENIKKKRDSIFAQCKLMKRISRYMFYLLVFHPSMLPVGISSISFEEIIDQVTEQLSIKVKNKIEACEKLHLSRTFGPGVLYDAALYVRAITDEEDLIKKWNTIGLSWLEVLERAARKCKGREHAQQLRRGGELLTHVWLLMAHFGLTDHFQIEEGRELARVILK